MMDLEEVYKEKMQTIDTQVKIIDSDLTEVNKIITSINDIMDNPEEIETLKLQEAAVTAIIHKVLGDDFDKSFHKQSIALKFIPSNELETLMNVNGIGKITTDWVAIAKDDVTITVTTEQSFTMKVLNVGENEGHKLAATLMHGSGLESVTEIKDQENGEYRIKGRCNVEGDWKMKVTAGAAHIKGSPVNIKVERIGLVQTIDNIAEYKENYKLDVTDVMLDKDGCILVSSFSKDLLKFNQSGSFVEKIQVPQDAWISTMHKMSNGHMVYSDHTGKQVVMCDEKFQAIRSFGKQILEIPEGVTVNEVTRILYVADHKAHCVFKFNVDDGRLLGQIGSEGSEAGQMKEPDGVSLTRDGHLIVVDFNNSRIQMLGMNNKFRRIQIQSGHADGQLYCPHCVTIDADENMLITSEDKLQLFDKNGRFIKRIDNKEDGLNIPLGSAVISNRPRRIAVANHKANNIKIFNY